MIGLQGFSDLSTPEPYYYPFGMTGAARDDQSWSITSASIADADGCLAPGDSFKLRSNLDGSYLADGETLTLGAHDDFAVSTTTEGGRDFDGITAAAGTGQTSDDDEAISVRVDNLDADGFEVILDEQEANNDGHADEVMGYLAIMGTPADTSTQSHLLTTASVNDSWTDVAGIQLKMQEENSQDNETTHAADSVNVFMVSLADDELIFAQDVDYNGPDTASIR